jgi:tetratricopeptide (TPR) repeat protein
VPTRKKFACLVVMLCAGTWAAEAQATSSQVNQLSSAKDQCAPEPGDAPPTLPAKILEGQGSVHFPITTTNPEAQKFFDQGVAQMHSFWAREAERSFLQAAALDPTAPMPWWGVAMVAAGDYRPGFQLELVNGAPVDAAKDQPKKPEDLKPGAKRALAAAQRALDLSAIAGKASDLELMYIRSVAARRGLGAQMPDSAYVAGLRNIVAKYPNEVEAKLYLALAIMSGYNTPDKTPRAGSEEAVEILRGLLKTAPDHPGVHHYVIHGWEGSTFANEAWPSCEKYPRLVPNIPHALHMPGHIYAQTGRWADAEAAFAAAATKERAFMDEDALYGTGHHGHNVHFEIVTLNFLGQYEKALALAQELMAIPETPRQKADVDNWYAADRQGWFALMSTLVSFEKWDDILDSSKLPPYSAPREMAWYHWARAVAYASTADPSLAKDEEKQMDASIKQWMVATKSKEPFPAIKVAKGELEGHMAFVQKKTKQALALYERASESERALRYTEPPAYPRPISVVAGNLALAMGDRDTAAKYFKIALEQYPKNPRAEEGLRAATGKAETVQASAK